LPILWFVIASGCHVSIPPFFFHFLFLCSALPLCPFVFCQCFFSDPPPFQGSGIFGVKNFPGGKPDVSFFLLPPVISPIASAPKYSSRLDDSSLFHDSSRCLYPLSNVVSFCFSPFFLSLSRGVSHGCVLIEVLHQTRFPVPKTALPLIYFFFIVDWSPWMLITQPPFPPFLPSSMRLRSAENLHLLLSTVALSFISQMFNPLYCFKIAALLTLFFP